MAKNNESEPVKIKVKINSRPGEFASRQISRQIAEQIGMKRIPAGAMMPSEDALAAHLGVGRKVVRTAYARLVEEGLLERNWPHNKRVAGGSAEKNKPTAVKGLKPAAKKSSAKNSAQKSAKKSVAKKASKRAKG